MSTCQNCQSPQVGNETFCSNCGTRVFNADGTARYDGSQRARRVKILVTILAALLLLGVIGTAGMYFAQ